MGAVRLIIFLFLAFLLGVVLFVQSVIQHEYIHQLIFRNYGINSNVTYNFWGETKNQMGRIFYHPLNPFADVDIKTSGAWAWTTPAYDSNYSKCNETCELLHTQNEFSAQQIDTVIMVTLFFFCLYLLYKEIVNINNEVDIEILKEEIENIKRDIYQDEKNAENNQGNLEEM